MNKIYRALLIVISILMIVLTILSLGESGKIFYTYESALYLTDITGINVLISTISILFFVGVLFLKFKNIILKNIILVLIFCIWFLSGRVTGLNSFANGRLNYGWYCLEVNKVNLCIEDDDCERLLAYQTKIEKLPFWRIRVENKNLIETAFIGPFRWKKTIQVLEKKIALEK